jgi:hypothetical protein
MSQEEVTEQLDRILENLKQFRLEEKMKAAVRELEELAARQERVNEELDRAAQDEKQDGENGDAKKGDEKSAHEKNADEKKADEKSGAESGKEPSPEELERLAREEKALADETRRTEETMKELSEMTQDLRDSADHQSMKELAEQMQSENIPKTMDQMSSDMESQDVPSAEKQGEKALTQLRQTLMNLRQQQGQMQQRQMAINQAAINRAVRDLLSLSADEETLALDLESIPSNSTSATRSFADEQYLLIQGAERVEKQLQEVAKDTPLMDSAIGKGLDSSLGAMRDAAYGLENGAVQVAQEDGAEAVEGMNAVVIELLSAAQAMSSCSTGMPMSSLMQQLQDLAGDQQKLNGMLQQLLQDGGQSQDRRLQASLRSHAEEQQRIREQLAQLLDEIGEGQGFLGRLDDVEKKLDEVGEKMSRGEFDEGVLQEQEWALTRLLDAQRSIRERDFGKERRSTTAEELAELLPPSELAPGLDEETRDLREDLLKALDRRYPPKYEELIRKYFRSLTDEAPAPDLP